jgi:DNA-binding beta-propeller fold protein YncE
VDHNDFVYIAGNGTGNGTCGGVACPWAASHGPDSMVLKFAADGTFIYQIGDPGVSAETNNDTDGAANGTPQPYRPADMEVDPKTNELYIADGYGNRRVLVVDAETGLYLRHWGAYGQNPVADGNSGEPPGSADPNFKNPVHCVRIVGDLVYVCDRINNRIQVFDKNIAGALCDPATQDCGFVTEQFIAQETLGNGSTWDVDTSPDKKQSCLFNPDGTNQKVWILERETLEILDSFGRGGRSAGQFHWVHNLAADSKGNLYTAEVDTGKRAQKFVPKRGKRGGVSCRS